MLRLNARWLLLLAYAGLLAFGAWHHELFRDEADAWIATRDASWPDLLSWFGYSGHPPLWYIVLLPFAGAGLPVETMQFITFALAMAFVWLLLWHGPFALWVKAGLLFSVYLGYQYPIVVRGYLLMLLVMTAAAVCYPRRFEMPKRYALLLALLYNTEAFAVAPAALLSVFFTLEWLRRPEGWRAGIIPVTIAGTGALVFLFAMWPPADRTECYLGRCDFSGSFLRAVAVGFPLLQTFHLDAWMGMKGWPSASANPVLAIPGLLLLSWMMWALGGMRWRLFLAGWVGWFYFIFTYKYPGYFWHYYLLPVFAFLTLWFASGELNRRRLNYCAGLLGAVFLLTLPKSWSEHEYDFTRPFSGGKEMAEYVQENYPDRLIVSAAYDHTSAFSAYMPPQPNLVVARSGRRTGYHLWNRRHPGYGYSAEQYAAHFREIGQKRLLVLSSLRLPELPGMSVKLLHATYGRWEKFYLYRVRLTEG